MKATRATWLCLALVGALYGFHVHLKTAKIFAHPTWSATDEVGQFWSEFAFHYRFAKFFAEHPVRDWGQLARDRAVQFPDTINDWAEFTVAMEVPVGVLYRWVQPGVPFHVWVVWYDCVVSSLTLFGVFLLARALWRNDWAGLAAAVLYAGCYPSYGRTVKNLFLREDFALPLIVLALWATVRMWQDERRRYQVGAAVLWVAALASWHLTPFVLAVGVGATVLVYLGRGETPRRPWFVGTLAAGAVGVPVLWAKQFYLSPPMCALYALGLAVWINGGRKRASLVFVGWLAALLAAGAWLGKSYGEYAHVYQLFWCKLWFLGVKPVDPALLPWEARCLWEGAFETAGAGDYWGYLGLSLPLAAVGAWKIGRREVDKGVVVVFTVVLAGLSWMVVRYFTFLAPVTAVLAAGLMTRRVWWRAAVAGAAVWGLAHLDFEPLARVQPRPEEYRAVVAWLNAHTPAEAVVLASVSEGPVVLAHTGRAIVLHSKFENWAVRERYRELLAAIYGSEAEFHAFARRVGADYFVYDTGFLLAAKDSRRYKADRLGELPADCAAVLFEEQPERLRYFEPVLAAGRFMVLRVRRAV